MKFSFLILLMVHLATLTCATSAEKLPTDQDLDFHSLLSPVPEFAKLSEKDYFVWGGSMVRGNDGKYHLFYSRWKKSLGFSAWVTNSEVAHAVADNPLGPYRFVDVALPRRHKSGTPFWDGSCTHNPTVHKFDGKYYLYYMGNTGDGKNTKGLNWSHRNNQRIGVAVADSPNGPWKRRDQPLIDISNDRSAPDALLTTNPSICRGPDKKYVLVYKAVGLKTKLPFGGPVVHMVATSDSPTGPFKKHASPIFTLPGKKFPAEDPFIWSQNGSFWAIVKDMHGDFTDKGKCLVLFHSKNGIDWKVATHPLASLLQIEWNQKGKRVLEKVHRLERPQLWMENGIPKILFCAVIPQGQQGKDSYNVHIPLKQPESK